MELFNIISGNSVILFILLFSRIGAMVAFFPFFSYGTIPVSIKTLFALFLTFFLFPFATMSLASFDITSLILAVLSEIMFGFIAGLILQIIFGALGLAGEQISFVMGFSMASTIDPMTGISSPVIGRFFTLLAVLVLLAINAHHLILIFLSNSVHKLVLGGFYPDISIWRYILKAVSNMFIIGFVLSFPIIALSLLSDVIFGMLMKTMPQFNLLVVGFPIKITISLLVLTAILSSFMYIFKEQFSKALSYLPALF